jgi:hypothetical protein
MEPDAANLRVLGVEFPHAQPFDVDRACRDLEDAAQPVGELLAWIRVPAG